MNSILFTKQAEQIDKNTVARRCPLFITKIAIYRPRTKDVEILYGNWTIGELSLEHPISICGIDTLLRNVPVAELARATVVFYDNQGRAISHDPRVFIEDII